MEHETLAKGRKPGIWKDTAKHSWECCVFHLHAFLSQRNQQGPIVDKVVLDWIQRRLNLKSRGGFKILKSRSICMQVHVEKTLPSNLRNKILKETAVSFYLVSFWSWFRLEPPLQNCTWQQIWHFLSSYWTRKNCKSSHCFPTEYSLQSCIVDTNYRDGLTFAFSQACCKSPI